MPGNRTTPTYYGNCADPYFADSTQYYYDWSQPLHSLCIAGICYMLGLAVVVGLTVKYGERLDKIKIGWVPPLIALITLFAWVGICPQYAPGFRNGSRYCEQLLPAQAALNHLVAVVPLYSFLTLFALLFVIPIFAYLGCFKKSEPVQSEP